MAPLVQRNKQSYPMCNEKTNLPTYIIFMDFCTEYLVMKLQQEYCRNACSCVDTHKGIYPRSVQIKICGISQQLCVWFLREIHICLYQLRHKLYNLKEYVGIKRGKCIKYYTYTLLKDH